MIIFVLIVLFCATAALGFLFGYLAGRAAWLAYQRRHEDA